MVAPADACVTAMAWAPTASALSDARVEKPSAWPPVASRIALSAATAALPLVKMFPERTLPAAASRSTLKVRLPTDAPVPADTATAFGLEEDAVSACHEICEEIAREAANSVVVSALICEYESSFAFADAISALTGSSRLERCAATSCWMIEFVSRPVESPEIDWVTAPLVPAKLVAVGPVVATLFEPEIADVTMRSFEISPRAPLNQLPQNQLALNQTAPNPIGGGGVASPTPLSVESCVIAGPRAVTAAA